MRADCTTARQMRIENEAILLAKAVNKTLTSLGNETHGLDLRQLTCKARLSLKTTKQALEQLTVTRAVEMIDGKYYLKV